VFVTSSTCKSLASFIAIHSAITPTSSEDNFEILYLYQILKTAVSFFSMKTMLVKNTNKRRIKRARGFRTNVSPSWRV